MKTIGAVARKGENMRPIDADHLKKWILARWQERNPQTDRPFKAIEILDQIDREMTVQPQPKTGKWIFGHTLGHSWMKCSECLVSQDGQTACFSYCPNCGAKMEGSDED